MGEWHVEEVPEELGLSAQYAVRGETLVGAEFMGMRAAVATLNRLEAENRTLREQVEELRAALAFVTRETATAYCEECGFLTYFEKDGEQQHEPTCSRLSQPATEVKDG